MRTMLRISLLACAAVVLLAPFARAQQCSTQVAVNVFDSHTKGFLFGLSADDFEATAGKARLTITSVKPVFRNRVLVLLDAGNSPGTKPLQDVAQLIGEAPPGMPVAVGIFGRHAIFTRAFIPDNDELISSLDRLLQRANTLGTGSNFRDALTQALAIFGSHQPGDTILLVTSGREHASKRTFAELRKEFRRRGARLQLLAGPPPAAAIEADDASAIFSSWMLPPVSEGMVALARATGGAFMGMMNSDWPQAATSGYMLSITTPAVMKKSRNWNLKIRDAGNDVPPADLFYPEELSPCSAPLMAALPAKAKPRP